MNDFTKDELKELFSALCDRHEEISDFVPINPLRRKIRKMIDNYCEHQDECNGNHMYVIDRCSTCGKVVE